MDLKLVCCVALFAVPCFINAAAQQDCYCSGTQTTIPLPSPIVTSSSSNFQCLPSSSGSSADNSGSTSGNISTNSGTSSSNVGGSTNSGSTVAAPTISLTSGGPSFTGPAVPTVSLNGSPSINIPTPTVTFPSSSVPSFSLPTSIDCPKSPEPQVINHPDVNIPLPLPSDIPLGQYCACQRYAIKPTIVQCSK